MTRAAHPVEIPEAPIVETFHAVFEQSVAALEAPAARQTLREAWPILSAGPECLSADLAWAEDILSRGLDILDETRDLPDPGRHFLRVALLHGFAKVRLGQGREAEALFIRVAAAGYVADHLRLDRHPLHGFLLFFQASRSFPALREPAESDALDCETPFTAALPVC